MFPDHPFGEGHHASLSLQRHWQRPGSPHCEARSPLPCCCGGTGRWVQCPGHTGVSAPHGTLLLKQAARCAGEGAALAQTGSGTATEFRGSLLPRMGVKFSLCRRAPHSSHSFLSCMASIQEADRHPSPWSPRRPRAHPCFVSLGSISHFPNICRMCAEGSRLLLAALPAPCLAHCRYSCRLRCAAGT